MKKTLDILNGLANENRFRLFLALLARDACVCELQAILDIEQSRLSHQLRTLKFFGLVEARQDGRWIVYSVPEKVKKNPIVQAIEKNSELPLAVKGKIHRVKIWGVQRDKKLEKKKRKEK